MMANGIKNTSPARGAAALEHLFCRPDPASGDLAVPAGAAGLLLGAQSVTMADIFENAVNTAAENVRKNGFDDSRFRAFRGNVIDDGVLREQIGSGYDIITANIVADVIIGMSPIFGSFLADGGTLIVSGIIDERLDEVLGALTENGFGVTARKNAEGWNAIVLSRV